MRIGVVLAVALLLIVLSRSSREPERVARVYEWKIYLTAIVVQPIAKRGVAMTSDDCADATALGASWLYNWNPDPPACEGVESIAMSWRGNPVPLGGNAPWLLGANEPDLPEQGNLTPLEAAHQWTWFEETKASLVSPSPTNIQWLVDWRNEFIALNGRPPKVHALAAHCYDFKAIDCQAKIFQFAQLAAEWNVNALWVTEFNLWPCYQSMAEWESELRTLVEWMEIQPIIKRYAVFASRIPAGVPWSFRPEECNAPMFDGEGGMTSFGKAYFGR